MGEFKAKMANMTDWFMQAPLKQKITLIVGCLLIVAGLSFAIYQALPQEDAVQQATQEETEVTVDAIEDTETVTETTDIDLTSTPTTNEAIVQPSEDTSAFESNAATVEVNDSADVYYADDGAIYESEPVYEEPVYEEPVSEPSSGGGDWSEQPGADNSTPIDTTGSDGSALFTE